MRCLMSAKTDVGRQRLRNEDNFILLEQYAFSAVADGMGGHIDGNIASQIAVDTLKDSYENRYQKIVSQSFQTVEDEMKAQEGFIVQTVQEANKNIFVRNKGNFKLEGMGTTLVALQIQQDYALTACVGDSRIYHLRDRKLAQVTQDHSLVGELIRYNIIDKADVLFAHNKNIITRALGMTENVLVDTTSQKVIAGDIFLLCSDGLTDLVSDEEMEKILGENADDLNKAVEELVGTANDCGGQDNITVVLVKAIE